MDRIIDIFVKRENRESFMRFTCFNYFVVYWFKKTGSVVFSNCLNCFNRTIYNGFVFLD